MYRSYNYYPPALVSLKPKHQEKRVTSKVRHMAHWQIQHFQQMVLERQLPKLPVYFRGHQNASQVGAAYGWAGHAQGITINGYMSQDNVLNVLCMNWCISNNLFSGTRRRSWQILQISL